jgi:ribosomal protein S21
MVFSWPHMAINVQVEKNNNESSANVIRRFQKRVQGAGIIQKVRSNRYYTRLKSSNVNRMARLKKLAKKETYEKLLKLGKVKEQKSYRR